MTRLPSRSSISLRGTLGCLRYAEASSLAAGGHAYLRVAASPRAETCVRVVRPYGKPFTNGEVASDRGSVRPFPHSLRWRPGTGAIGHFSLLVQTVAFFLMKVTSSR